MASQVWAAYQRLHSRAFFSRAQRLTASQVWAAGHERQKMTISLVLNALRHQRFGQQIAQHCGVDEATCSTPYGIRGLGSFCVVSVL